MTDLAEIRRPLALFVEGVAGVALELDAQDRKGSDVLVVPATIDRFDDPELNRRAFLLAVLERLGRRMHGADTFESGLAESMLADLLSANAEEVPRDVVRVSGSQLDRFLRLHRYPELVRSLFEVLEFARIRAAICRSYPGVKSDVARDNDEELSRRAYLVNGSVNGSGNGSVVDLLTSWAYGLRSEWGESLTGLADAVLEDGATVYRSMEIALLICTHFEVAEHGLFSPGSDDVLAELSDDGTGAPVVSDGEGAYEGEQPTSVSAAVDLPEGPGTALAGEVDDGDYLDSFSPTSGRVGGDEQPTTQWRSSARGEEREQGVGNRDGLRSTETRSTRRMQDRAYRYPEWDYHVSGYRPDWCRLIERRVDGTTQEFMNAVRRDHATLRAQIKRRLGAMRPEQRTRVHGTSDGDELAIDAIVGAVIDRRAGRSSDDHLYIRRDRAERDVAAAFLIDLSRSTDSPVVTAPTPAATDSATGAAERYDPFGPGYWDVVDFKPTPVERRVIDVSKEAVAVLCESLQMLGDRHAIYGFSGRGREQVDFLVAKEFGDRPSSRTWSALGAMEPMSYTRMGPSIRHASAKIAAQGARTRILLVISDGYPQDEGYGPEPGDRAYGMHDTAQALREAEAAGITTFCITVDPAGHDYLRDMCPEDRYLVIDDMAALAVELEKVYAALTLR